MGVKKVGRPMNKAKNLFVKWLKENGAEDIEVFEGARRRDGFDYYRNVDGFIDNRLITCFFMVWKGEESIDYADSDNRYKGLSIEEFLQLIN